MAAYPRMPPISSLMPQPWPAVSPVQTKLWPRLLPALRDHGLLAFEPGAVLNEPRAVSPALPSTSSKCMVSAKRVPDGRSRAWIFEVKSVASLAVVPRSTRLKARLPRSGDPSSSTASRLATSRPGPDARDHRTPELVVTSPVEMPDGRVRRLRTRGTADGRAAWAGTTSEGATAAAPAAAMAPLRTFRRERAVMVP
jgi:hypothetical protein